MTALIEIERVSKAYRRDDLEIPVLDEVSLQVAAGEFMAVMGPSGSGKTTLLNLIAGLDRPSAGRVLVGGAEISQLGDDDLSRWRSDHVGLVFQLYNLIPVLTAFENVELPLLLTGLDRRQRVEHVEAALAVVGLADRMDHYPRQLSGGQEQRVAIARAIVTDPVLLVADEPTGDLDAKSAEEVLDLLNRLNAEFQKTIVMVTHDPRAAAHARRIVHLDKGVLTAAPLPSSVPMAAQAARAPDGEGELVATLSRLNAELMRTIRELRSEGAPRSVAPAHAPSEAEQEQRWPAAVGFEEPPGPRQGSLATPPTPVPRTPVPRTPVPESPPVDTPTLAVAPAAAVEPEEEAVEGLAPSAFSFAKRDRAWLRTAAAVLGATVLVGLGVIGLLFVRPRLARLASALPAVTHAPSPAATPVPPARSHAMQPTPAPPPAVLTAGVRAPSASPAAPPPVQRPVEPPPAFASVRDARLLRLLDQAEAAASAQRMDEAGRLFDQALVLAPGDARAEAGRAAVRAALAAQRSFAVGRTSSTATPARESEQPAPSARIDFEVTPAVVQPGARYTVKVYVTNEGDRTFRIGQASLYMTLDGARQGGPVAPRIRELIPRQRALLVWPLPGMWPEVAAWSMEVSLTTDSGVVFTNQLTWQ